LTCAELSGENSPKVLLYYYYNLVEFQPPTPPMSKVMNLSQKELVLVVLVLVLVAGKLLF
jgi:hypothetical protein